MQQQRCTAIHLPDNNPAISVQISNPYIISGAAQRKLVMDLFRRTCIFGKYAALAMLALGTTGFLIVPVARGQVTAQPAPPLQENAPSASTAASGQSVAPATVRVVRLAYVEGNVQILRGSETEFSQALMNMPIVQGSRIATGEDGRAEVEFEDGSVARLVPNSSLTIEKLEKTSDGTLKTTLEQIAGLAYYELRSDPKIPFTVIFGNRTAVPTANATFRVNLDTSPIDLAVLDGSVQVQAGQGGADHLIDVQQGKTVQFNPALGGPYNLADVVTPSPYDQWNDQRDHAAAEEAANETAARKQQGGGGGPMGSLIGYGWSDLDNSGGWYPMSGYGMVWQPDGGAEAGFDPYGSGGWAMTQGLGYSWVSGYSWGWLPFHYGMWSYIDGFGWGWMPGQFGYGGSGYGGYGGYSTYTGVTGAPSGYAPPKPPVTIGTPVKGGKPPRTFVPANRPANGRMPANGTALRASKSISQPGTIGFRPRPVHFRGSTVEPLRPVMHENVPIRNAALYNNYSVNEFHSGIRTGMMERTGAISHGGFAASGVHNGLQTHRSGLAAPNLEGFARSDRTFNSRNPFDHASRSTFGQHTNFGSHGSFGATSSGIRSGNIGSFSGGGGLRGAGPTGGGMASGSGGHASGGGSHGNSH